MSGTETLRSFVNSWECDENRHMNVQFYWKRFHEADRHARHAFELPADPVMPPVRHVRYHQESHEGDLHIVRSEKVAGGPYPVTIAHYMTNRETGALVATALDGFDRLDGFAGAGPLSDKSALGRSLPDGHRALSPDQPLSDIPVTFRGMVTADACDETGHATPKFIVGAFSDAASHAWEDMGLTKVWLNDMNYGRVAVEKKISTQKPLPAHMPFIIRTALTHAGNKTFSFIHILLGLDGTCYMLGEITGLAIDLNTRRAVAFPDDRRALMEKGLVARERILIPTGE